MYYQGHDRPHDTGKVDAYRPAIGRVRVRLDGFVSQDAGSQDGQLTTVPFTFEGQRLEVNMDGSSRGWLKVEILDEAMEPIEGFTEKEADRLAGNEVRKVVTWEGKNGLSCLCGKPVRLRFVGQSVKLYAFQFVPDK